jgi:hypothetical protein
MSRTITLREYLVEELNRRARERGQDVELVVERPGPRLATEEGQVVQFGPTKE